MGGIKGPLPAKLIVGVLSARTDMLARATTELSALFGPVDFASALLPFTHTDFYNAELGTPILRQFLSFERLFDQGALSHTKHQTNALELSLAEGGSGKSWRLCSDCGLSSERTVNLDPGYVTGAKLVLASTKDHGHRVYIGDGIYAEVTLRYHKGCFQPWPWTYPDYASPECLRIFEGIRRIYMPQLRTHQQSPSGATVPAPARKQSG